MYHFYRDPIDARLVKLRDSGQTGVLRVSGDVGGAFYLREGEVVFAESRRTPGHGMRSADSPEYLPQDGDEVMPDLDGPQMRWGGLQPPAKPHSAVLSAIERRLVVREATFDAATEMLSSRPRYTRFRSTEFPGVADVPGVSLAELLQEVNRRQAVLKQLSALLTADTRVARNPRIDPRGVQVSALQWALLIRVGPRSTPRGLALDLGHGVFGTTIEVFRLVALRLLTVDAAGSPTVAAPGRSPERLWPSLSFVRAVTE